MVIAKFKIDLQWKEFNVDLNAINTWMKANAGADYCGTQASNKLELWFLEEPTQEVKDAIQETKNYALSPRKEKPADYDFYTIEFKQAAVNQYQYIIYEEKDDLNRNIISVKTLPPTIKFKNFNSLSPFSSPKFIRFSIKDRGAIIDPTNEEIFLILSNTNISDTDTKKIILNKTSGQVKINE